MPAGYQTLVSSYDRLFDQARTNEYNLSIRLEPDGLSFSVYSAESCIITGVESIQFPGYIPLKSGFLTQALYRENLLQLVQSHPVLKSEFKKTVILLHSQCFTIVPAPLFNPGRPASYLSFVHKNDPSAAILTHRLSALDATLVYSLDEVLYAEIANAFRSARLMHTMGAVVDTLLPRYKHSDSPEMVFLNVQAGSAGIVVLRDKTLELCNMYECQADEDMIYFLMFIMEQLSLNPEKVPVFLSGKTGKDSALYELIRRYVRYVEFDNPSGPVSRSYALSEIEKHRFVELLNPALCE